MKFGITTFLLLVLAVLAFAADSHRQIIVSYPQNTPSHVLEQAMDAIKQAGGTILHEYNLIKGFAVSSLES